MTAASNPSSTDAESSGNPAGPGDRLVSRVGSLGARSILQRSDRWMLVVGATLAPLGMLLIVLGWLGAAHTPLIFEQIPYLISGGQLGLAFVVFGGFLYFSYWHAVRVREARAQHAELVVLLSRLDPRLGDTGEPAKPAPRRPAQPRPRRQPK